MCTNCSHFRCWHKHTEIKYCFVLKAEPLSECEFLHTMNMGTNIDFLSLRERLHFCVAIHPYRYVCLSVRPSVTLFCHTFLSHFLKLYFAGDTCIPRNAATIFSYIGEIISSGRISSLWWRMPCLSAALARSVCNVRVSHWFGWVVLKILRRFNNLSVISRLGITLSRDVICVLHYTTISHNTLQ